MGTENIIVSIIVSVYNVERYLSKCIQSLITQTYQNLEIILVDDGSSDGSAVICDEWKQSDSRIVVYHQSNAGVSAARNRGLSVATGDYIAFVDSDDWLDKVYVEKLVKLCNEDNLVLTGYAIDYEGVSRSRHVEKKYCRECISYLNKDEVVSLFRAGLFSPVWNKLYKRNLLIEKKIKFRENMNLGEDIVFNLDYFRRFDGGFEIINEPLYHYMHFGEPSLTGRYNERYVEQQIIIYKKFMNCISEISINAASYVQLCCLYFDALVTGLDNLYLNRNDMDDVYYHNMMSERRKEQEFKVILGEISGKQKLIYTTRYFFIRNGLYIIDFYLRKAVKRLLRLE